MLSIKKLIIKILNELDPTKYRPKVLWSGGVHMNGSQTINLSEAVTKQRYGIVLAWSAYVNNAPQNYDWNYQFIPKEQVIRNSGSGVDSGVMSTTTFSNVGSKYLYIHDTKIVGNDVNKQTGTASGISYKNNFWVLRYVYGV